MANNTQRDELHKTIWAIADSLRGAVGGWEFKAYVLGAIFYRYISENITRHINLLQAEAGITDYDYAQESDENAEEAREGMVGEKGYFILPSQLFLPSSKHTPSASQYNSSPPLCLSRTSRRTTTISPSPAMWSRRISAKRSISMPSMPNSLMWWLRSMNCAVRWMK